MYGSIEAWFSDAAERGIDLPTAIIQREARNSDLDPAEIRARILETLEVMEQAIREGLESDERSPTGMTGGRAKRLSEAGIGFFGPDFTAMLASAIATLEVNARMGLIVAAPTAGAAGVVPGVLLTLRVARGWLDEALVDGMLVAGGVGGVIAERASIAGAGGGCQAETGSAAAMAAAAVTHLEGGGPPEVSQAVALRIVAVV